MSEKQVERVARAIHDARYGNDYPLTLVNTWEQEGVSGQQYCLRLARAAIEALPARTDETETARAWLVECPKYHPGEYFALCECGCGRHYWTTDVHKAARFPTKEEAETARGVADAVGDIIAEHVPAALLGFLAGMSVTVGLAFCWSLVIS
jgi:hypothetical protein